MGQQPKVVGLSSMPCILKQSIQTCRCIILHISHNFMKTSLIRVEQERKKEMKIWGCILANQGKIWVFNHGQVLKMLPAWCQKKLDMHLLELQIAHTVFSPWWASSATIKYHILIYCNTTLHSLELHFLFWQINGNMKFKCDTEIIHNCWLYPCAMSLAPSQPCKHNGHQSQSPWF